MLFRHNKCNPSRFGRIKAVNGSILYPVVGLDRLCLQLLRLRLYLLRLRSIVFILAYLPLEIRLIHLGLAESRRSKFSVENTDQFLDHYRDAKEEIHKEAPPPRGRALQLTSYVDASHAANKVSRRSHTGYLIFAQRSPLVWFSKMQKTVESAAFGAEFIAMRTCVEHNRALRFKLRMFGIPIAGPTRIMTDNESVLVVFQRKILQK